MSFLQDLLVLYILDAQAHVLAGNLKLVVIGQRRNKHQYEIQEFKQAKKGYIELV